jgi:hypothetical protein
MSDATLQLLVDKQAVSETVTAYFQALDRFDWPAVERLIADRFMLDSDAPGVAPRPVSREEFMTSLKARNGGFTATIHLNPGHLVTVDGDTAHLTAHMWAAHVAGPAATDGFWGYGLYDIDLARTEDGWQLTRQRIQVSGVGGEGKPADVFALSAQRQAAGEGHY